MLSGRAVTVADALSPNRAAPFDTADPSGIDGGAPGGHVANHAGGSGETGWMVPAGTAWKLPGSGGIGNLTFPEHPVPVARPLMAGGLGLPAGLRRHVLPLS